LISACTSSSTGIADAVVFPVDEAALKVTWPAQIVSLVTSAREGSVTFVCTSTREAAQEVDVTTAVVRQIHLTHASIVHYVTVIALAAMCQDSFVCAVSSYPAGLTVAVIVAVRVAHFGTTPSCIPWATGHVVDHNIFLPQTCGFVRYHAAAADSTWTNATVFTAVNEAHRLSSNTQAAVRTIARPVEQANVDTLAAGPA
jgi:hypothetical protein